MVGCIIGARSSYQGFLLLEAAVSLMMVVLLSTLLFSWHAHLMHGYQTTSQVIQALYTARSLVEQIKAAKTPLYNKKLWQVAIVTQNDPILSIMYATVSVSPKNHKLKKLFTPITLKTVYKL